MSFFIYLISITKNYFYTFAAYQTTTEMKFKHQILIFFFIISSIVSFIGCGVDRWPEYASQTERDQWIDSVMRENYLWYNTIPSSKTLNYFLPPANFLQSLLYKAQDNNYSKVDTIYIDPLPTYGFNYILQKNPASDTAYYALINYVLPQSPASDAGLERGNWIMEVNNTLITKKNESKLLKSFEALNLTLGEYTIIPATETEKQSWTVKETKDVEVATIRPVEINPIHYYTTITTPTGVRLGYLVYNEFLAGTFQNPEKYNQQLLEISKYFAGQNITHFVLDLRYNTGGSFDCSQLLATILAPQHALGTTYATLTYNDIKSDKNKSVTYDPDLIKEGNNLNIQQGFIISSSQTSPSIAGVFLNCINPLKRWALVGTSINCWGVATEFFDNRNLYWGVSPVVCFVENSENITGQNGSFKPNVSITETSNLSTFLPFGNPQETLLNEVINMIDGTSNN